MGAQGRADIQQVLGPYSITVFEQEKYIFGKGRLNKALQNKNTSLLYFH